MISELFSASTIPFTDELFRKSSDKAVYFQIFLSMIDGSWGFFFRKSLEMI